MVQYARGDRSKHLLITSVAEIDWGADTNLPGINYTIDTCSWHSMSFKTCDTESVVPEIARGDRSKLLIGDMMSYAVQYDVQDTVKGYTDLNSWTAEYSVALADMNPWMK